MKFTYVPVYNMRGGKDTCGVAKRYTDGTFGPIELESDSFAQIRYWCGQIQRCFDQEPIVFSDPVKEETVFNLPPIVPDPVEDPVEEEKPKRGKKKKIVEDKVEEIETVDIEELGEILDSNLPKEYE